MGIFKRYVCSKLPIFDLPPTPCSSLFVLHVPRLHPPERIFTLVSPPPLPYQSEKVSRLLWVFQWKILNCLILKSLMFNKNDPTPKLLVHFLDYSSILFKTNFVWYTTKIESRKFYIAKNLYSQKVANPAITKNLCS